MERLRDNSKDLNIFKILMDNSKYSITINLRVEKYLIKLRMGRWPRWKSEKHLISTKLIKLQGKVLNFFFFKFDF